MKKPEDIPLDESGPLKPDKVLFIKAATQGSGETTIFDVTKTLARSYDGLSPECIYEAETSIKDLDASHAAYFLTKQKSLRRETTITDNTHTTIAQFNIPHMKHGLVQFSFPPASPHSTHDIEMKPVGFGRRAEGFVKDGVQYFWDKEDRIAQLTKVVDGGEKKVEVARFGAMRSFDKSGVLAVGSAEIDELVAVVTCAALLQQLDTTQGPMPHANWAGLTWGGNLT